MEASMRLEERVRGGLIGLLVGDALGVPYEFRAPDALPAASQIEFAPPPDFDRAHQGLPPGTWSDDGAHALCLLASLLACGRLDVEDLGRRLVAWQDRGYYAVDRQVFDVGIQTGRALQALRRGTPALQAGSTEERALGNGSLMRVLPLALWHHGTDAELVADAQEQSRATHGHLRAQICCALYCLWARRTLEEQPESWRAATASLRQIYAGDSPERAGLEWSIRPDDLAKGSGDGYVVDYLRSARWAVQQGPYEVAVRAAIALGHDTDTTAAVTGGIAGLRDGIKAIPLRWREGLRGQSEAVGLLEQLVAYLQLAGPGD
jgi:ADP-ribosyl-[dinitrogen reductase] hydrolase